MQPDDNDTDIPVLPEDNDTPAAPPVNTDDQLATHPATDANLDSSQIYDEGVAGAAEITEPGGDSATTGFDPEDAL